MSAVRIYDCTLRDGMQGEGMSLSAEEKVQVAHVLDGLGIGLVEAGFPASNPKEAELFRLLATVELEVAQVCAFGMTRRRGVAAEEDAALQPARARQASAAGQQVYTRRAGIDGTIPQGVRG